MHYQTLTLTIDNRIARLTLNRPEVHNAFNEVMLAEILEVCTNIAQNKDVRILIFAGNGKSFSAGADLNWMRKMINYTYEENFADSMVLAKAMNALYSIPQPTIARVQGAAIGGGMGFVTGCDIAIASDKAIFSLSEVKIGLIPACIGPYVIRKVGPGKAREFFITGERMTPERALNAGFINQVVPHDELDQAVDDLTARLLSSGPEAIAYAKELIDRVPGMTWDEAKRYTADMIARIRIGDEAQEGCAAFLEKRKPGWIN
ncbi:MAG: enoyl-CoA hydratase/isomerase family protein [candidate division Zixibacteria bacterium]|nr:enoyl-CoA hydratase/isomerase family protein [Candidatus Tariuqbacter arcticus]